MSKNLKFIIFVLAIIFITTPNINAKTITNNNGIVINEEDYENFLKIHSHEYIMNMSEEKYERLKELDYSHVITDTKYVLSTYHTHLGIISEREVSEEEYNTFNDNKTVQSTASLKESASTRGVVTSGTYYETTGKRLSMAVVPGSVWHYVTLLTFWKYMPSARSFDVIGLRGNGVSFRNGSQIGEQIYKANGTYHMINYAWNGTNIKRFDNGFGISMNLVDQSINALQCEIDADFKATTSHPELFGSYQHATSNLTLAQSQSYSLSGAGLGGVFAFPSNISVKYDHMAGVRINY